MWGGRVACAPTKTVVVVDAWGSEAVITPGDCSDGMSGRMCEGTVEILRGRRKNFIAESMAIRGEPPKCQTMPRRKSEEAIVAKKAWTV